MGGQVGKTKGLSAGRKSTRSADKKKITTTKSKLSSGRGQVRAGTRKVRVTKTTKRRGTIRSKVRM